VDRRAVGGAGRPLQRGQVAHPVLALERVDALRVGGCVAGALEHVGEVTGPPPSLNWSVLPTDGMGLDRNMYWHRSVYGSPSVSLADGRA
jgi:hypothetical protein